MHHSFILAHLGEYSRKQWFKVNGELVRREDSIDLRREWFLMYTMGGEMGGV